MTNKEHIKKRKIQMAFEAISIEGGLLSPEWFSKIAHLQSDSQKDIDYKIPKGLNLRDEIGRYYRIAQGLWLDSQLHQDESKFVSEFLKKCLGFEELISAMPVTVDDRIYPITHYASEGKIPVVLSTKAEGFNSLSARFGDEHRRRSAFGLVQEYLNASDEVLWGIVSQGESLRILRDNSSLTKPAWIEADLKRIFEEDRFADFAAFWLACHRSRFGEPSQQPHECVLEKWRESSRTEGIRAQDHLRSGVEEALEILGQGFISNPQNKALREALQNGSLSVHAYFQELLRLVYRLIFLLTIEERGLLHPESASAEAKLIYTEGYSVRKLRNRAIKRNAYDRFGDLWEVLKIIFKAANRSEPKLGMPALGGLFSETKTPNLDQCSLENRSLLGAVYHFTWLKEISGVSRVNWRDMGPEELGSVYESLLELIPRLIENGHRFTFASESESKGNERKLTGSYYTPDSLVQSLLDTALEPVVEQTIKAHPKDTIEALLKLKVIDPACGSGHFLLAAARRLAAHIARIEVDGTPSEKDYRKALREVIGHCIYGVDLNPMAIELCKVALWLEAVEPGKPLTFLDHHIKHGNSLLGVIPRLLKVGIPDGAFTPITGDDKKICSELKKKNKKEREGKTADMFGDEKNPIKLGNLVQTIADLNAIQDDNLDGVHKKEQAYHDFIDSGVYKNTKLVCDAWCAAFVWEKTEQAVQPLTTDTIWQVEISPFKISPERKNEINRIADQYHFFHFHLEFPDVFSVPAKDHAAANVDMGWNGGFDVVLGNPPWERVKLEEKEWFASRIPEISNAASAAERKRLIQRLQHESPQIFSEYESNQRRAEGESQLIRSSGKFPLCGRGDINLYAVFAEAMFLYMNKTGYVGCVVPSGIATDDTTKFFFQKVVAGEHLVNFFDFWNRKQIFPGVQAKIKFCLLTLSNISKNSFTVAAQLDDLVLLQATDRKYSLTPIDIEIINPNTRNCPTFATGRDAKINLHIYQRVPILISDDDRKENFWNVELSTMFHMSNDSGNFRTYEQLIADGYQLYGPIFRKQNDEFLPLYEAKLVHQYNHRAATFDGIPLEQRFKIHAWANETTSQQYLDPQYVILPRYWINSAEVSSSTKSALRFTFSFRNTISAVADSRSLVASVLPFAGVGNSLPLIYFHDHDQSAALFLSAFNTFVLDYIVRQKASGGNLNFYILKQIPILPPNHYSQRCLWDDTGLTLQEWIIPRVLELAFTSWDLEAFSQYCGWFGSPFVWDEERRFLLRCEIDAAYFHLYGVSREDSEYIMETFPIVKRKDVEKYNGEYGSATNFVSGRDYFFYI